MHKMTRVNSSLRSSSVGTGDLARFSISSIIQCCNIAGLLKVWKSLFFQLGYTCFSRTQVLALITAYRFYVATFEIKITWPIYTIHKCLQLLWKDKHLLSSKILLSFNTLLLTTTEWYNLKYYKE